MAYLEVDAKKIQLPGFQCNEDMTCFDAFISLTKTDLKCVLFLLMNWINYSLYINLVKKTKEELLCFLKNLICQNSIKVAVFIEIFCVMKKYHLLKKLNSCRHQIHHQWNGCISHIWKFLFTLCTDVDDEELRLINHCLFKNSCKTETLEETICLLFVQEDITEQNFQPLSKAFQFIRRMDLVGEVKKYKTSGTMHSRDVEKKTYLLREPTKHNPCGLAVILNEENFDSVEDSKSFCKRRGSHIDRNQLCAVWKRYGFHTEVYNDLKSAEITELFENICTRKQNYDIFVACLLSHGHEDVVYGSDCKEVKIPYIVNMVANKCESFSKKPKLFFIQACQEYKTSANTDKSMSIPNENLCPVPRPWCDVYIAKSTVPGHVSYRNIDSGSIFISVLVEELSSEGHREDIELIMKRVKDRVSLQIQQMPSTTSTLCANVIFKKLRSIN